MVRWTPLKQSVRPASVLCYKRVVLDPCGQTTEYYHALTWALSFVSVSAFLHAGHGGVIAPCSDGMQPGAFGSEVAEDQDTQVHCDWLTDFFQCCACGLGTAS